MYGHNKSTSVDAKRLLSILGVLSIILGLTVAFVVGFREFWRFYLFTGAVESALRLTVPMIPILILIVLVGVVIGVALLIAARNKRLLIIFSVVVLVAIVLISAFLFWPQGERWMEEQRYPLRFEALIVRYSEQHDLDPFLVKGLIQAESSFRDDAVSPVGAIGLMQIMPNTGEWLAELMGISFETDDLFNPAYNIRMGTFYLRRLINYFGHQDTALAAYNAGMGNVRSWLNDERYSSDGETLHTIPFPETRAYVERVNEFIEIYRRLYG
ncbi:MAG: lytic transglycosylase domain-containing protein [Oscillospiraceae bacterium]|nr:lytic transglycosylase domain-containing protein [Oscillospiraceae bacterium]